MDIRKRLLRYVLAYKGRLLLAILCGLIMAGCNLFFASLVGWFTMVASNKPVDDFKIIQLGIKYGWFKPENSQYALLMIAAVLIVLIRIPGGISQYFNNYLIASITNRIGADVRAEIYAHLQTLNLSFFQRSRIGDIMSRMSNDVNLIQNSSTVVMLAIDGPPMIVGGLIRMFMISWQLALLAVVFVPLMGVAIDRLTKRIRRLTTDAQQSLADLNSTIEESINGVRIIKSFGMEENEIKRFNTVNNKSLIATLRYFRRSSLVAPVIELMGAIAASIIIFTGGIMLIRNAFSFGQLAEFGVISFYVSGSAKQFGRLNITYQQILAAADRVFQILDTKSELPEDPNGVELNDVQGRVEFQNVCFEYVPGELVLDNVSFSIEPGEVVAIVGPSGTGKSTIADLIPRFYDVTSGKITVDGYDIRNIKTKSLRKHIGIVPQDTILFSGTIAENIAYGKPGADINEIIEVAKAANAHDFIMQTPNGYDTILGERGVGLSGGQRQRIAIARALLKNPRILILDEATSSLDAASEGVVQEALERLMKGRSTLVIAHRLSTVTGADRILVMDRGRIIESGSFEQLMSSGGTFAQLYRTQHRAEEAAESLDV